MSAPAVEHEGYLRFLWETHPNLPVARLGEMFGLSKGTVVGLARCHRWSPRLKSSRYDPGGSGTTLGRLTALEKRLGMPKIVGRNVKPGEITIYSLNDNRYALAVDGRVCFVGYSGEECAERARKLGLGAVSTKPAQDHALLRSVLNA